MKFNEKYRDEDYLCSADNRAILVLKDKGESREYRGLNPDKLFLTVYQVDGKLLKARQAGDVKCDYAVYTESDILYLVELKGGDYSHALEQLQNTIQLLIRPDFECPQSIHTRVVLSKVKVPNFLNTKEKKLMELLKKKYNGTHKKSAQVLEERLG